MEERLGVDSTNTNKIALQQVKSGLNIQRRNDKDGVPRINLSREGLNDALSTHSGPKGKSKTACL
jgi:hypothetical protein